MKQRRGRRILVTGGCGYVGSILVPKLAKKYPVTVLDSMFFGNHLPPWENVNITEGDIRDTELVRSLLSEATDVIHLASIANDPSSDLDPAITYAINRDAVAQMVSAANECGVRRFINASSSSVYGVKEEKSVTEELSLEPLTLYARLKAETDEIIASAASDEFTTVSIRSATVCGVSPRMRFDVIVNIMAKAAVVDGVITVFGGDQHRPNIHIDDITNLYALLVDIPAERINGKIFNFGATNHTVKEIAEMVRAETGATVKIDTNVNDNRSYRISSQKIKQELGFEPKKTIRQAIKDIKQAFASGGFPEPDSKIYYNVRTMRDILSR